MLQLEKSQYHVAAFFEQDSCSILVCTYTCILQTFQLEWTLKIYKYTYFLYFRFGHNTVDVPLEL